ncbi:MAG: hypothetical protein CO141_03180 [Candidatus Moranbacteria bacterium CG_4_9_14_3_um_filter_42_9]|nr:MAG: hypothetical protein CO141_03180 [Candidatus Moranbacteria bacterium CG_4_9_14_3_um_filter_42_9]
MALSSLKLWITSIDNEFRKTDNKRTDARYSRKAKNKNNKNKKFKEKNYGLVFYFFKNGNNKMNAGLFFVNTARFSFSESRSVRANFI